MKNQLPGCRMFIAALLLAACVEPDPGNGWQGVMRDSAGITVVENPEQGLWAPDEAWTVTVEWVIGHGNPGAEYEFGTITSLAAIPSGVVVFDALTAELRVFDETGAPVRVFGRRGGGPGEFGPGVRRVLADGDTLYVPDSRNRRIHRFRPTGEMLEALPHPRIQGGSALGWARVPERGFLFHLFQSEREAPADGGRRRFRRHSRAAARVSAGAAPGHRSRIGCGRHSPDSRRSLRRTPRMDPVVRRSHRDRQHLRLPRDPP